jgi:hypothetical protein
MLVDEEGVAAVGEQVGDDLTAEGGDEEVTDTILWCCAIVTTMDMVFTPALTAIIWRLIQQTSFQRKSKHTTQKRWPVAARTIAVTEN